MSSTTKPLNQITLEEFLAQPETKPASEYINGRIYQKPMAQGEHSVLQGRLLAAINEVGIPEKIAHAFSELRCAFSGSAIVPDITVFEGSRIPRRPNGRSANKFTIPPDWIIEILSPEQSASRVIDKITFCLKHGTKLGWFIEPEDESIMAFLPNQLPDVKYGEEKLPVLEVLGDWQISVVDVFSWLY